MTSADEHGEVGEPRGQTTTTAARRRVFRSRRDFGGRVNNPGTPSRVVPHR